MDGSGQNDEYRKGYQSSFLDKSYGVHEYAKGYTLPQGIVPNEEFQCGEQEKESPRQCELEFLECPDKEINLQTCHQQEYRAVMELQVVEELTDISEPVLHLWKEFRVGEKRLVGKVVVAHMVSQSNHQCEDGDNHVCISPFVCHRILVGQKNQDNQQYIIDVIGKKHISLIN
jgi:hypothetical protein